MHNIYTYIPFGVVAACAIFFVWELLNYRRLSKTEGLVVGCNQLADCEAMDSSFQPVIEFMAEGRTFSFLAGTQAVQPSSKKVKVVYDSQRPELSASIFSYYKQFFLTVFSSSLALATSFAVAII